MKPISDIDDFVEPVKRLHGRIRQRIVLACEEDRTGDLASISKEGDDDTIYGLDGLTEDLVITFLREEIAYHTPVVLIAEGIGDSGRLILPTDASEADARWRMIMDPIDGTRGLMYQKRSAWILTGVAPNRGPETNLQDIQLAVQTEIPLIKQHLSDILWAVRGGGVTAERFDRITGKTRPLYVQPSGAKTIAHGFSTIARFFPSMREELAAIDEEIVRGALGPVQKGKAHCFEDQYISTGGQLYGLISGQDRFIADLRPVLEPLLEKKGLALGICCHPYDLCTELIAREAGVIVTDISGAALSAALNVTAELGWAGYANQSIRAQIEPLLRHALKSRGLID